MAPSLAIFEMLDATRRLRQRGARIAISLVDSAESDLLEPLYTGEDKYVMYSQGQRQRLMASVVETRASQYPDHAIVFFYFPRESNSRRPVARAAAVVRACLLGATASGESSMSTLVRLRANPSIERTCPDKPGHA
jgi:hypothetical protein